MTTFSTYTLCAHCHTCSCLYRSLKRDRCVKPLMFVNTSRNLWCCRRWLLHLPHVHYVDAVIHTLETVSSAGVLLELYPCRSDFPSRGSHGCCPLPCGRYLPTPLTDNKYGSKERTVLFACTCGQHTLAFYAKYAISFGALLLAQFFYVDLDTTCGAV